MDVRWFKIDEGISKPYFAVPNARFWIWWNSAMVKITVPVGEEVSIERRQRTDEGWSMQGIVFTHEGSKISRSIYNDAHDCDGRMSSEQHDEVSMMEIIKLKAEERPNWKGESYEQRDYEAERAGY